MNDVLTSCPCCQYLYYFHYIFHFYPTHHPSGDGPSGWMNLTKQSLLPSLFFHHNFPPHIQPTQLYREVLLYTIWVGPQYSLKTHTSKKLVEQEIQILSFCLNVIVYNNVFSSAEPRHQNLSGLLLMKHQNHQVLLSLAHFFQVFFVCPPIPLYETWPPLSKLLFWKAAHFPEVLHNNLLIFHPCFTLSQVLYINTLCSTPYLILWLWGWTFKS